MCTIWYVIDGAKSLDDTVPASTSTCGHGHGIIIVIIWINLIASIIPLSSSSFHYPDHYNTVGSKSPFNTGF
jgi:hypothetical protein